MDMTRPLRRKCAARSPAALTLLLCLAMAALAGCGSSGDEADQQAALEQARKEGAQSARQNEKIRELQRQVDDAQKGSSASSDATIPSSGGAPSPVPSDPTSYVPSYQPYTPSDPAYSYVAEIPTGGGWTAPVESRPTGGNLLRTSLRGPDGTLLIVDRTPDEVPQLGGSYDAASTNLQTNFGAATEYIFSRSDGLPDCNGRPCADFLISDGNGGGWGVLGGGPSLPVAESIASHVAQSISFGE